MGLRGQGSERGYAMAALLVSLMVMSVLMSVALPVWRNLATREKEAELIFRGEQYARAVALYRVKNGNNFPPNIDVLVQGKFLRKKYLDPTTHKDFDIIVAGAQPTNPQGGQSAPGRGGTQTGTGRGKLSPPPSATPPSATQQLTAAGIMGVHSKSQETSIKIYKGQNRYDLWTFVFTAVNRPGGNTPTGEGSAVPGGRGPAVPGGPGGRGPGGRGEPGGRGRGMDFPRPPIRGGGPGGNPIIREQGRGQ
jgi:type II secretory pathway pseudopilin PulG